jgi:hypothetical protein
MPVAHYPRYRFPPAIISHAVWLYYRSTPVSATSKTPLAQRGITVSYESIRHWCESFGAASRTVGRLPERNGPLQWSVSKYSGCRSHISCVEPAKRQLENEVPENVHCDTANESSDQDSLGIHPALLHLGVD